MANTVFDAIVRARDESTPILTQIEKHYQDLGHSIERAQLPVKDFGENIHAVSILHREALERMVGHVDVLRERFSGLRENVFHVGESLKELLPAISVFGAAASVAGVFETVSHVSERYGELAHTAAELGTGVHQLQLLQAAAHFADVNFESMTKSAVHLNRALSEAAHGKNHEVGALFSKLHLHPGSYQDALSALPDLADKFEHTRKATDRTRIAFALFGKSGADLIPFLSQGGKKVRESLGEAAKLVPDLSKYPGLEKYNEHSKMLGTATQGFMDSLGAKLEPALDPIITRLTEGIATNRETITTKIADGVVHFADALQHADFNKFGAQIERGATALEHFVEILQLVKYSIEGLAALTALRMGYTLAQPLVALGRVGAAVTVTAAKISAELVGAWRSVAVAARASAVEEIAAAELGAGARVKVTTAATEAGRADLAARQASIADRVRNAEAVAPSIARATTSAARRLALGAAGIALGPEVATGLLVDAVDSDDKSGKWIDAHIPGAARVDNWIYNLTGGAAGRSLAENGLVPAFPETTLTMLDRWQSQWGSPASLETPAFPPIPLRQGIPSAGTAGANGDVRVRIDVRGLPETSHIETEYSGSVSKVETNRGSAWDDFYP